MAITRIEPINVISLCEFKHEVPAIADFRVFIGTDYACRGCIEHAKKKCDNCEEPLKNDNVICKVFASNNKERTEYWCRDCDTADYVAGIAD